MIIASFLTTLGIVDYFVSGSYANSSELRYCPVQNGKILLNLWISGIMLLFYGFLNLCSSGLIPALCAKVNFKHEAIFFADVFQGIIGNIVCAVIFAVLLCFNAYSTSIMVDAYKAGLESDDIYSGMYCHRVPLYLYLVTISVIWGTFVLKSLEGVTWLVQKFSLSKEEKEEIKMRKEEKAIRKKLEQEEMGKKKQKKGKTAKKKGKNRPKKENGAVKKTGGRRGRAKVNSD